MWMMDKRYEANTYSKTLSDSSGVGLGAGTCALGSAVMDLVMIRECGVMGEWAEYPSRRGTSNEAMLTSWASCV